MKFTGGYLRAFFAASRFLRSCGTFATERCVSTFVAGAPHSNYDISPDGRTFAMVRQNPATRIIVLQNMPALFRQLERGRPR